jgi:8-oxo-dGTP pyrophosphatase MutT (NUDIX family)
VASNHVSYHVGKLIEQKILKKTGTGYRLTTVGKSLIDRMSLATFTERIQPKIVTLIVCTNATGDMLLYRRRKQPFLGKVGFPYGKIHMGERVADAAAREFQEKTGLTATMRYRGDVYTAVYDAHHELIVHTEFS